MWFVNSKSSDHIPVVNLGIALHNHLLDDTIVSVIIERANGEKTTYTREG